MRRSALSLYALLCLGLYFAPTFVLIALSPILMVPAAELPSVSVVLGVGIGGSALLLVLLAWVIPSLFGDAAPRLRSAAIRTSPALIFAGLDTGLRLPLPPPLRWVASVVLVLLFGLVTISLVRRQPPRDAT